MDRINEMLYLSQSIKLGELVIQLGEWQQKAKAENKAALTDALVTVIEADRTIKQLRHEISIYQDKLSTERGELLKCQSELYSRTEELRVLRGSIEEVF